MRVEHAVHVVAVRPGPARRAQGGVQHGAALGGVDGLAAQHRVAPRFQAALARQVEQEAQRGRVDEVLRQVGKDLGRLDAKRGEAPGVAREGLAQVEVAAVGFEVALQRGPGVGAVATGCVHGVNPLIMRSSLAASAAKARMPSASFSVPIASSFSA